MPEIEEKEYDARTNTEVLLERIYKTNLEILASSGSGAGTPVFVNTSGTHTIPSGAFDIGVINLGAVAADVDGVALPAGAVFGFVGETSASIEVDGGGTANLFIKYMT